MIGALVEQMLRIAVRDERAHRCEDGIGDAHRLQAGVAEPVRDHGEDESLGGPRDRQRRVREQVSGAHGAESERRGAKGERKIGHSPPVNRRERDRPDAAGDEQRHSSLGAIVEDLDREDERDSERREGVAECECVDLAFRRPQLKRDRGSEKRQDEDGSDGDRCLRQAGLGVRREPLHLRADEHRDRNEQTVPAARDRHGCRRDEDERGKGGRLPAQVRVERL